MQVYTVVFLNISRDTWCKLFTVSEEMLQMRQYTKLRKASLKTGFSITTFLYMTFMFTFFIRIIVHSPYRLYFKLNSS